MSFKVVLLLVLVLSLLAACSGQAAPTMPPPTTIPQATAAPATQTPLPTYPPTATLAPSATPLPTQTVIPSRTPIPGWVGPDSYPAGTNPLTGLPAADPSALELPPALISVSTFPYTARPQAGLSKAPFVYDVYYGDGMTRYLAVIYGDLSNVGSKPLSVGPIRSGRLPWEPLRAMIGGFLLIANGDESVLKELNYYTNVFSGINDVNSVFADAAKIQQAANSYLPVVGKPNLSGLAFSPNAPDGGKAGTMLWIPYAFLNQVIWRYDAASGAYNRYQDNYDGTTFIMLADRLDNQPVEAQNVIVLFAYHNLIKAEKIDVTLANVNKMPALLFRDGKMYEIFWNSSYVNSKVVPMRFEDAQGNPVPLKPGHTWVQVVTAGSPYFETVDSKDYGTRISQNTPGSGVWAVKFLMP
jgi:hypothetical protein